VAGLCHLVGCGLASPLGADLPQTWQSLLAGKFIENHSKAMGFEGPGRFDAMALAAAAEALAEAKWQTGTDVALVLATSKGPIVQWTSGQGLSGRRGGEFGIGLAATRLAGAVFQHHGIKCTPSLVVSGACASGLLGLIRAAMMIRSGEVSRVLVVAAEASVEPMFVESFRRLGVLAEPSIGCRPFDTERCGFLMSEAAAAVCVEAVSKPRAGVASRQDDRPAVVIDRFACGAFAGHLTATQADGSTVRHLLGRVLAERPVDLIHAHGTGTDSNDAVELAAIEAAIEPAWGQGGGTMPNLYSHKAALGHSQGAAGLISVVLNCQMHRFGQVPGNMRTTSPLPTTAVRIDSKAHERSVRHSVALASGFGGVVAAVGLVSEPTPA
jgi:3-oxoacyl-[acyl-carrier-protein] synthase II